MQNWIRLVAAFTLVTFIAGCAQPTAVPPTEAPPAVGDAPTDMPAPTEEVAVPDEMPVDAELAQLLGLSYQLPNGSIVSGVLPEDATEGDNFVVVGFLRASGDLNADGAADYAVILADVSDPTAPQHYLAVVTAEGGGLTPVAVVALPEGLGVESLEIVDGEIQVKAWSPDYEALLYAYALQEGAVSQSGEAQPRPTSRVATPMAATPMPAATGTTQPTSPQPQVSIAFNPEKRGIAGAKVDVYTHAFDNPNIVKLELHVDGTPVPEEVWNSPDPEGVPYIHHTFTIRSPKRGVYMVKVIAYAKDGASGWSPTVEYPVK